MKPIYLIIILVVVLAAAGGMFWFANQGQGPQEVHITNFDECVAAGYPVQESYPAKCTIPDGKTFTQDIGNELEKQDLIRITNPRPNQEIRSPLLITGQARGNWFFEASFPVKLLDERGNTLVTGIAQAQGEWMTTEFVPFQAHIEFDKPAGKKGTLILEKDNPSGLPEQADELRVPVVFGEVSSQEMITVQAYFNNSQMDPEFSCNKVFSVNRQIPKTQATARAALEELLKGTTNKEQEQGFFSSLNSNIKIQQLNIANGVARVDFDEQLQFQVGGSCRVAAIRAQITQTLKQFSTVQNVVISINGRTEDILQP
ncbi:MAG: GerMN domain-containing protein [Candidatus Wildermuthbacteria bacterium]|nr:GerMN domain-containing protein [Candidatus Wildermuthbacteria bacterium]